MKWPRWLCHMVFSNCKWEWVQNRHITTGGYLHERREFVGLYECKRCGDKSNGSPRNPLTGRFPE